METAEAVLGNTEKETSPPSSDLHFSPSVCSEMQPVCTTVALAFLLADWTSLAHAFVLREFLKVFSLLWNVSFT